MVDNGFDGHRARRRLSALSSALQLFSRKETGMSVIATSEQLVEVPS
jgi:hypothetical protein